MRDAQLVITDILLFPALVAVKYMEKEAPTLIDDEVMTAFLAYGTVSFSHGPDDKAWPANLAIPDVGIKS